MDNDRPSEGRVKVTDKRRSGDPPGAEAAGEASEEMPDLTPDLVPDEPLGERDYLDDLRRLQAEFDNYRKRMVKEQTALSARASANLIEQLLPIVDHFEAALDHGEGGDGIRLVYEDLMKLLAAEGLSEIAAVNEPFDPQVHDAFESHEEAEVDSPVVRSVVRRGYRLGDRLIRPSLVVVARPIETEPTEPAPVESASVEAEG